MRGGPTTTAVLLHGWGGTGAGLARAVAGADGRGPYLHAPRGPGADRPRCRLLTPDLGGHGAAADHRPVDLATVLGDLAPVVRGAAAEGPVLLGGYSLGARLALQLALARPAPVAGLLLVAATGGLEGTEERARRRRADAALADALRRDGLAAFVPRWQALDLWAGDPPAARARQAAELAAGDPEGLAAAIEGLSPGVVPAVWDRLGEVPCPVEILVGERDARYRAHASRLAAGLPDARVSVVPGAGHGLPREAPDAVGAALARLARRSGG